MFKRNKIWNSQNNCDFRQAAEVNICNLNGNRGLGTWHPPPRDRQEGWHWRVGKSCTPITLPSPPNEIGKTHYRQISANLHYTFWNRHILATPLIPWGSERAHVWVIVLQNLCRALQLLIEVAHVPSKGSRHQTPWNRWSIWQLI